MPGTISLPYMPKTIPCPTPDQMIVEPIQSQLRTMAQAMPEAVAALDIILPGIVEGEKTKPARKAALIMAAEERAALVAAVKKVCEDRGIKRLSMSQPYAKRLRSHVIGRLERMKDVPGAAGLLEKPLGIGRLLAAFKEAQPAIEGCQN